MVKTSKDEYWLKKSPEEVADRLQTNTEYHSAWYGHSVYQAWVRNHIIYYSNIIEPDDWATSLIFDGEQGELVRMQVPQARSLVRQLVSIITKAKLSFNSIAETKGTDVINAVRLGNALSNHIVRDQTLDLKSQTSFERSLVQGLSFMKASWRTDRGEPYAGDSGKGAIKYTGDIEITTHSPYDVRYDSNIHLDDWKNIPWVEVRTIKNRWDLIAQHPDLKDEILSVPTLSEMKSSAIDDVQRINQDDLISVFELYVRPSPAIPKGRMMMYSSADTIYHDGDNLYETIPIEPMCPEPMDGIGFGYPFLSNLLPAQEMLDHSFSAIATNQSSLAISNVAIPRGAGVSVNEINGMNFISFTPQNVPGGGKPEVLNLAKTSPETFKFVDLLKAHMLELSNINGALRGSPPPGVTSGVAIATLTTNALEFLDSAAKAYNTCLEKIMYHAINAYRIFATVEHTVEITGKNDKISIQKFKGDDLKSIKRIKLTIANPLMQTMAGRSDIAEKLVQSGLIKDIQQYVSVIDGSPLKELYEDELSENDLVKDENEALLKDEQVIALSTDDHAMHIRKHAALLNDPKVRVDNDMVASILDHIMEHYKLSGETDPGLTAMVRTGRSAGPMDPPQGVDIKQPPPSGGQAPGGELPPVPGASNEQNMPEPIGAKPATGMAPDLLAGMR